MKESAIKVMCEVWSEMNAIRARDGVPYMHNGWKSDVSQEYWDDMMDRLNKEVIDATGKGCWLHPVLYNDDLTKAIERLQYDLDADEQADGLLDYCY